MNSLQHYFEQQNDKEAASIVADVVALLPSDTSVINWKNQGDVEKNGKVEEMNENVVLNNILLTKEVCNFLTADPYIFTQHQLFSQKYLL